MLEARAKIEHVDEYGDTSLTVAALRGRVAIVKLLIDHNAKVNAQNHLGNTALLRAIQEDLKDEFMETVQILLKHGANAGHQNKKGLTPLMKAAELSDGDAAVIMQHLLEGGVALDAKDNEGRTALMHACIGGSQKTRELLLDSGATIEAQDDLGDTALIIAAGHSDRSAVGVSARARSQHRSSGQVWLHAADQGGQMRLGRYHNSVARSRREDRRRG